MLTSTECHEIAKQKLVQAEHEPQHRTRLLTAAQGWLVLENELRRLEANVIPPKASRRSRPTSVGGATAAPLGQQTNPWPPLSQRGNLRPLSPYQNRL
jgi:hypothetical protein